MGRPAHVPYPDPTKDQASNVGGCYSGKFS